jgi:K+-transporting ATPase KdpF subunit
MRQVDLISVENGVLALLTVIVLGYLIYALLRPQRF